MNASLIKDKVKQYCKGIWGLDFDLDVVVSSRMTKVLGQFEYIDNKLTGEKKPLRLKFSKNLLNGNYKEDTIESVILHETCHYALCVLNKPFKDHHPVFEAELKRIGASSTNIIRIAGDLYQGCCSKCGKIVVSRRSLNVLNRYLNTPNYASNCCDSQIVYKGNVHTKDTYNKPQAKDEKVEKLVKQAMTIQLNSFYIHEIIQQGPKGITNKQMIPAMKIALDENSKEKLDLLKQHYPEIFEASIKYIGKKYQDKLNQI